MYCFSKFCRLCLAASKHLVELDSRDGETTLFFKLVFCLPQLGVDNDTYPRYICPTCHSALNAAYKFHRMCLRNMQLLYNYRSELAGEDDSVPTDSRLVVGLGRRVAVAPLKRYESDEEDFLGYDTSEIKNSIDFQKWFSMKTEGDNNITDDNNDDSFDSRLEATNNDNNKPLKCNICNINFNYKSYLNRHMLKHRNIGEYKCDECGKMFKYRFYLKKHTLIHANRRSYLCKICDKSFYDNCGLNRHMTVHSERPDYKCAVCEKSFKLKINLTKHLWTHTMEGSRPLECSVCGNVYRDVYALKNHMMDEHSGCRPFKCDICGREFKQNFYLKKHLMLHDNVRPFACDICKKTFRAQHDLKVHTHFAHNIRYNCRICLQGFSMKCTLDQHMKIIHDEDEPEISEDSWVELQKTDPKPSSLLIIT